MNAEAFDRAYLWHFRARLFTPGDGDTAVLLPDLGFRVAALPPIRLAGWSAPERWEAGGAEATRRLSEALQSGATTPWPLRLITRQRETVVNQVTSFERYVGDILVQMPDGELVDVTEMLG